MFFLRWLALLLYAYSNYYFLKIYLPDNIAALTRPIEPPTEGNVTLYMFCCLLKKAFHGVIDIRFFF